MRRSRVLSLSCHLPWPPVSGGRRRELELLMRVAQRFTVHLVVVSKTPAQDRANARVLAPYCEHIDVFAAEPDRQAAGAARAVLRHHCPAASARVAEILTGDAVDLIHVEGFYLMQHVPEWTDVAVVLVEQNVEFELERQRAAISPDPVSVRQFMETEDAERRSWRRATRLATVTAEDSQIAQRMVPESVVAVVPDGADHVSSLRVLGTGADLERPDTPLLVLVANFAYAPNVDAVRHLHEEVLPLIRERVPDVRLWLVGDAPPHELKAMAGDGIEVTGRVPEVVPYLDAADVVVCPLRIGGGIKVKTIEALRRGKAVVSTSVGAQGLPEAVRRRALVVSDEPREFADAVVGLLREPKPRRQLEQRAAHAARDLPSWDDAAGALMRIYDELVAPSAVLARDGQLVAGGSR